MLKIASWNVNSLKVRLEQVQTWLQETDTAVIGLQETKLIDEHFPKQCFEDSGYHIAYTGQKTYNGVALISRYPLSDVVMDIPNLDDPARRMIAATVQGLRVINLYVPNGSAVGSDKYAYKLRWLTAVMAFIRAELVRYPELVVMGDFNIAPADLDVHDPQMWEGQILVSEPERAAFQQLLDLGLSDSFRTLHPQEQVYSWWDYRAMAFRRNMGLRIDHILLSTALQMQCQETGIDKTPRRHERPSDHAPVWVSLGER